MGRKSMSRPVDWNYRRMRVIEALPATAQKIHFRTYIPLSAVQKILRALLKEDKIERNASYGEIVSLMCRIT